MDGERWGRPSTGCATPSSEPWRPGAAELEGQARQQRLEAERLDLTEVPPGSGAGHLHLVTQAIERLEDVFVGMGFTVAEGPEVETDWNNFGALNFPPDHPARDMYDTLYVEMGESGSTVLRTHTSPVQVRVMTGGEPPIYSVMPGRVFRQDTPDATHMPVFHQIEGLVIDRDITFADLAGTLDTFTKAYFGGDFASRLRPSYFPFTEPSAEYDIIRPDGSFLELGGCGMVHPNVLTSCGLDPEDVAGVRLRVRHRPSRHQPTWRRRPPRPVHQRHPLPHPVLGAPADEGPALLDARHRPDRG